MTLDDFFTSTELENGLMTPNRVNELITVMQSEKDLVVNSFGQATQQWSKVATSIAATENKDCLDLFIQLNGLLFIDKWLKDAQKLKIDDENGLLEELVMSLLRALEKLQIDEERLCSSGVMKTVQDLVTDNNHTVSEKAKELCGNWMLIQDKNKNPQAATNSMDSDTKNQEPLDRVEPSNKPVDDDDNNGELSSKSEQVASVADVDNSLESCIKTDVLSDKDDDEGEGQKTSSNTDRDNEAENEIKRPNTPDSNNGQSQPVGGSDKVVLLLPEPVKDAETLVSQISEVAQESELDTGFDLNQEVCSEDPGTHNDSNQRSDFHDFDLNVAEGGQEDKMVIIPPGPPSGEESSVANPRKPERLQWDLNSVGDDQSGWQSQYHGASSSSSLSSSSSSKQPILRNIDLNLNDQPNGEDSVVSLFGAKVKLMRENDHKPQLEPKFDFNYGRPLDSSMPYGNHNSMFLSMPMYASSPSSSYGMPMPYMVDSRGTPFVPQMMGSQPSPFFMNMAAAGAPSGASGLGPPPQHNFDLNTGVLINGGLRQFFTQNVNEQVSSSSVLGKRTEPDSSWQFFPVNKRQQPPWR